MNQESAVSHMHRWINSNIAVARITCLSRAEYALPVRPIRCGTTRPLPFCNLEIFAKPVEDAVFTHPSDRLSDYFALLDGKHCRDAAYSVSFRESLILIGIYLDNSGVAGQLICHFPHHRCELPAVRSPWSPEFGKDRPRIASQEIVEGCFAEL